MNPDDRKQWHKFTLDVPRALTADHRCPGCSQHVPSYAGPPVASHYHYLAGVIAEALVAVAQGRTYAQASRAARIALARAAGHAPGGADEFSTNGQLAADWVEVFADVVLDDDGRWPDVVILDGTRFYRFTGAGLGTAFHLLCAHGYDLDPNAAVPTAINGRFIAARLAPSEAEAQWKAFFATRRGVPAFVVTDGDAGLRRAVRTTWPRATGTRPGTFAIRCTWHIGENLRNAVRSDLTRVRSLPEPAAAGMRRLAQLAPTDAFCADALADACAEAFTPAAGFTPGAESASLAWLAGTSGQHMRYQHRALGRAGGRIPTANGPVEADIVRLRTYLAARAQSLRNADRTTKLLNLLAAGLRNEAAADIWAARIYDHLATNGGRPATKQRQVTGNYFR